MASINRKPAVAPVFTSEGGRASHLTPLEQLRRLTLACLLFERNFYVDGESIADAITAAVARVAPQDAADVAIEARERQHLRHAPLWIVRAMAALPSHRPLVAATLARVIQRPDEIGEFLALYWHPKRQPLAASVKKGLARAFGKFNEYSLAKYDRASAAVRLRDVLFLTHAKPRDAEQADLWKRLVDGKLTVPDTWETQLSAGADKRATFERLMSERKLGGLALLRNMRNMQESGVPRDAVKSGMETANFDRVLPFRFVAAARVVPLWEDLLDEPMLRACSTRPRLPGRTILLVDVSGSMNAKLSTKSDLSRLDAASALAVIVRELADEAAIYTFSQALATIPPRRGFALIDAVKRSQPHSSTYLAGAITALAPTMNAEDRFIVITDEQSHDGIAVAPTANSYVVNVASSQNGVGYRNAWRHIDGWSESIVDFIVASEGVAELEVAEIDQ